MLKALPSSLGQSPAAQALLHSAGMPQSIIVKNFQTLVGGLKAHTHKDQILQIVSEWEAHNRTDHQTYLGLEMMVANDQIPRQWLADAAEVQHDWQSDSEETSRSPTPAPIRNSAASTKGHAAL